MSKFGQIFARWAVIGLALASTWAPAQSFVIFGHTNVWRYQTESNLDPVLWQSPAYNDAAMLDETPPHLVSAVSLPDRTNIVVTFSEDMGPGALDPLKYIVCADETWEDCLTVLPTSPDGTSLVFTNAGSRQVLLATPMPLDRNQSYVLGVGEVSDLAGNLPEGILVTYVTIPKIVTFQQGVNGYTGTVDTHVRADQADTAFGTADTVLVDSDTPVAHGLLRFDNIIGAGGTQVPASSLIKSATLRLRITSDADPINLHLMLQSWGPTATWNSLVNGLSADNVEASSAIAATFTPSVNNVFLTIDVTSSVQAWAYGQANNGWFLTNTIANGLQFSSSEIATVNNRPLLTVDFGECSTPAAPVIVSVPPSSMINLDFVSELEIAFGVTGCPAPLYQWYFRPQGSGSFTPIAGATNSTYRRNPVNARADVGTYYLQARNDSGSTNSPWITVWMEVGDPPRLVSALATGDTNLTTVTVAFNEAVDPTTAVVASNYIIYPATAVSAVTLVNASMVQLTIHAAFGRRYILAVRNVSDLSGNAIPATGYSLEITTGLLLADFGATWSYSTNNTDYYATSPPFYTVDFNSSTWATGPGALASEVMPAGAYTIGTLFPNTASAASTHTIYFRNTSIVWPYAVANLDSNVQIVVRHAIDDGAVLYVNGSEAFRFKMDPAPAIIGHTNTDNATLAPYTSGEAVLATNVLDRNVLTQGTNTLAASLHAANGTSSDAVFAVQVLAVLQAPQPPYLEIVPVTNHFVVTLGSSFSLTFGVTGLDPRYQWYFSNSIAGFTAIAGATNNTYSVARAFAANRGFYYLRVSNAYPGATNSPILQVTVLPGDAPGLVSAVRQADPTTVLVNFSKPVFPGGANGGATNPANYTVTRAGLPSIAVTAVTLDTFHLQATLTLADAVGKGYTLAVTNVTDPGGDALNPDWTNIRTPVYFQEGRDGYRGTVDTYISASAATTAYGSLPAVLADGQNPVAHGLIRFDGLIGYGAGQISYAAFIYSATLRLHTVNVGDAVRVYRMTNDWNASSTWDSFAGGGGASNSLGTLAATITPTSFGAFVDLDVTASVQAWATGEANHGWALISSGTDGYQFDASESTNGVMTLPLLSVDYWPPPDPCFPAHIVSQPYPNLSFDEGNPWSISIVASGNSLAYQWQRSTANLATFTNIPGANSATYSIVTAVPSDAGYYRCLVTNPCPSSVTSAVCQVWFSPGDPPYLLSATARGYAGDVLNIVGLTFDEALNLAGASNPANYTVSRSGGGVVAVRSATLLGGTNVVLVLDDGLQFGVNYMLTLSSNVTDLALTPHPVFPSSTNILQQLIVLSYTNAWSYDERQVATNEITGAAADGYWTNTPAWYSPAFIPAGWSQGPGILAIETNEPIIILAPAPIRTTLTQPTHTLYFRTTFNDPTPALPDVGLVANHFMDDGCVCYLNGSEAFRFKMPTGSVTHATQAAAGGEAVVASTNLNARLQATNLVACSLHPSGTASTDAVFGLEIVVQYPALVSEPPQLIIRRLGATQAAISWSPARGVLQETASLSATPVWTDAASQAIPQTNAIPGTKFYRLRE